LTGRHHIVIIRDLNTLYSRIRLSHADVVSAKWRFPSAEQRIDVVKGRERAARHIAGKSVVAFRSVPLLQENISVAFGSKRYWKETTPSYNPNLQDYRI
jgi:hypothetical protein